MKSMSHSFTRIYPDLVQDVKYRVFPASRHRSIADQGRVALAGVVALVLVDGLVVGA